MIELASFTEGTGDPIVMLHGFTGHSSSMQPLTQQLLAHREVTSVDLVGHGHSPRPAELDSYSMPACVEQLRPVVALRGPAHLVGYSMGGRVALSFAVACPELVTRLTLIGARAGFDDPHDRSTRVAADEALAERILADGIDTFVDRWMAQPLFASQARLGEAALQAARRQRQDNDPVALANSLRGMGSGAMAPLHDRLGEVHVPVDVVVGAEDERFAPVADELVELLPRARRCVIADAGHAAHLEQPEAVAVVVLSDH